MSHLPGGERFCSRAAKKSLSALCARVAAASACSFLRPRGQAKPSKRETLTARVFLNRARKKSPGAGDAGGMRGNNLALEI